MVEPNQCKSCAEAYPSIHYESKDHTTCLTRLNCGLENIGASGQWHTCAEIMSGIPFASLDYSVFVIESNYDSGSIGDANQCKTCPRKYGESHQCKTCSEIYYASHFATLAHSVSVEPDQLSFFIPWNHQPVPNLLRYQFRGTYANMAHSVCVAQLNCGSGVIWCKLCPSVYLLLSFANLAHSTCVIQVNCDSGI